jgi:hypothetical protein
MNSCRSMSHPRRRRRFVKARRHEETRIRRRTKQQRRKQPGNASNTRPRSATRHEKATINRYAIRHAASRSRSCSAEQRRTTEFHCPFTLFCHPPLHTTTKQFASNKISDPPTGIAATARKMRMRASDFEGANCNANRLATATDIHINVAAGILQLHLHPCRAVDADRSLGAHLCVYQRSISCSCRPPRNRWNHADAICCVQAESLRFILMVPVAEAVDCKSDLQSSLQLKMTPSATADGITGRKMRAKPSGDCERRRP